MKHILLFTALLCVGCNEPLDVVIDAESMRIYDAKPCNNKRIGQTKYFVRDGSTQGWVFISDREFEVGDRLKIVKVESSVESEN